MKYEMVREHGWDEGWYEEHRKIKFAAFNMEDNTYSEIISIDLNYEDHVMTSVAHVSDIIHIPVHSLYFFYKIIRPWWSDDIPTLLFFPDNFHKEVKRPTRIQTQPDLANINVNVEFLKSPSKAAVEVLDENDRVEWREIVEHPGQTISLSIPLRSISTGQKRIRVQSLVMEETDGEDFGLTLNPSLTIKPEIYRLIFTAVDHNNVPVSDVSITVEDVSSGTSHSYLTDSSGTAIIEIRGPGIYKVTARKSGKKRVVREYEARGIVNETIVLEPVKLIIAVTDPQNIPVSGATVKLYRDGKLIAEDTTR